MMTALNESEVWNVTNENDYLNLTQNPYLNISEINFTLSEINLTSVPDDTLITISGNAIHGNGTFTFAPLKRPMDDLPVRIAFITCYTIVFALCLFGNLLVLFVIVRHPQMRSKTNLFLANLSASDLCVGIVCVLPNLSTFLSQSWLVGRLVCKAYYYVQQLSYTASVCFLTMISVERYIAICYPLKAKGFFTKRRLKVAILATWLVSLIYNVPQLVEFDVFVIPAMDGTTTSYCYYSGIIDTNIYVTIRFVLLYCLPMLVISIMYMNTASVLWRSVGASISDRSQKSVGSSNTANENILQFASIANGLSVENLTRSQMDNISSVSSMTYDNPTYEGDGQGDDHTRSRRVSIEFQSDEGSSDLDSADEQQGPQQTTQIRLTTKLNTKKKKDKATKQLSTICENGITPKKLKRGFHLHRKKEKSRRVLNTRRKVLRLLIAIVACFALCVLPFHIWVLLQAWLPQYSPIWFPPVSVALLYLNSGVNPILYALFSQKFRKCMKETFSCRKR